MAACAMKTEQFLFMKMTVDLSAFVSDDFLSYTQKWDEKYYDLTNDIYFDDSHPLLYYWPTD